MKVFNRLNIKLTAGSTDVYLKKLYDNIKNIKTSTWGIHYILEPYSLSSVSELNRYIYFLDFHFGEDSQKGSYIKCNTIRTSSVICNPRDIDLNLKDYGFEEYGSEYKIYFKSEKEFDTIAKRIAQMLKKFLPKADEYISKYIGDSLNKSGEETKDKESDFDSIYLKFGKKVYKSRVTRSFGETLSTIKNLTKNYIQGVSPANGKCDIYYTDERTGGKEGIVFENKEDANKYAEAYYDYCYKNRLPMKKPEIKKVTVAYTDREIKKLFKTKKGETLYIPFNNVDNESRGFMASCNSNVYYYFLSCNGSGSKWGGDFIIWDKKLPK